MFSRDRNCFFPSASQYPLTVRGQLLSQRASAGARIPGFLFSPPAIEQLQSGDSRFVQILSGILIKGDEFESSEHEAHDLRLENMPSGGN